MSEPRSRLFVPLGSNAHALATGGDGETVESVRRRLKFASIAFDEICLESGLLKVNAGPTGSGSFRHHDPDAEFQTQGQRSAAQSRGFTLSIGTEDEPGEMAAEMRPFVQSKTTFSWSATLQPFARELPSGCDWVEFVTRHKDPAVKKTAKEWRWADQRNDALADVLPEHIVRSVVLGHANSDLALGAYAGLAVIQDGMHRQVVESRFEDEVGWQATGFALPIHMPDVSDLDWESVRWVRKNKHMADFRKILSDIEAQALDEATDDDVPAVVHRALARYLAEAVPRVAGFGAMAKDMVASLAIGRMASVVTAAFGGPAALPVAMAMDVGPTAVEAGIDNVRGRKHRWTSVYQELRAATDNLTAVPATAATGDSPS